MKRVVCLGAAALDRKYHTVGDVQLGTSNPVSGRRGFGGVARNVAENLARLGIAVSLVSIVGADQTGAGLLAHLRRVGVDTAGIVVAEGLATAEYVAILDRANGLAIGAADMSIFDSLSIDDVAWVRAVPAPADWLFADCNLPAEILAFLIASTGETGSKLAIDAVSIAKTLRLPRDLHGIDLLFINESEARAILAGAASNDPAELARKLRERGAASVVLTLGDRGLVLADDAGTTAYPALTTAPRDVTGAGDALIAGMLFQLLNGARAASAVSTGILLASLTLESESSVRPDLSPALLESNRARREASVR
jgi:pseudouridine kinase